MPKKSADDFMLAEYARLVEFSSTTISMRDSRLHFFLAMISGAILSISLLQDMNNATLALFADFSLLSAVLWVGIGTFKNTVRTNFDIVQYQESMENIRKYFVRSNPQVEQYLAPVIKVDRKYARKFPRMTAVLNGLIAGTAFILLATGLINMSPLPMYLIDLAGGTITFFVFYRWQGAYFKKELAKVDNSVEEDKEIRKRKPQQARHTSIQQKVQLSDQEKEVVEPGFLTLIWASIAFSLTISIEAAQKVVELYKANSIQFYIWLVFMMFSVSFTVYASTFVLNLTREYARSKSDPDYVTYAYYLICGAVVIAVGVIALGIVGD